MSVFDIYNNKRVLVTGHTGFKGSWLSFWLKRLGAKVSGISIDIPSKPSLCVTASLLDHVNDYRIDVHDGEEVKQIVKEIKPDFVFHLAAQVEIGVGLNNPFLTFETNIRGTYSLLEAIKQFPQTIESIVVASSDKSYGSYGRHKMPYKEDYPLIPVYPYDVSKACSDMIARSYSSDVINLPIVVTRFCNIFGPGQLNFSALIPDAIRSALGYSTFIPRGSGGQIRDFLYVDDVVDLYLLIAKSLSKHPKKITGEVFNAGTNSMKSVKSIIENIYSIIGNENNLKIIKKQMLGKKTKGEIDCQYMDFEKLNNYFGWEPQYSFNDGMIKSIEWYKKYLKDKYESNA